MFRKMYAQAFIIQFIGYLCIFLPISFVDVLTGYSSILVQILEVLYRLAIGLFGNALYKNHIFKNVKRWSKKLDSGGVSYGAAVVWYLDSSFLAPLIRVVIGLIAKRFI